VFNKPTYIRVASDLHLDFDAFNYTKLKPLSANDVKPPEHDYLWSPAPMPEDKDTILVLPGDLWTDNQAFERRYGQPTSWLEKQAARFHSIVLVLGNHDYWRGALARAPIKAKEHIAALNLTNVHLLERSTVCIGDVKFVGGTLWTDYNDGNYNVLVAARDIMKDYRQIRATGYRTVRPVDLYEVHRQTWRFISNNSYRDYDGQTVVIVTHMAPSYQSINERHRTASNYNANFLYFSDLDKRFYQQGFDADYWFHGHTHNAVDYTINKTRVVCNPRGYALAFEDTGFDPLFRIKLHTATQDELNGFT
jgi:predicted phosphodiesterase